MGSVYSLTNTANLGGSWSDDIRSSRPPAAERSNQAVSTKPSADDPKDLSTIPSFSTAEQLKGTNPSEFQQVVTDAVTNLKAAAKQSPDPFDASFLWDLANRFQLVLDTGGTLPTSGVVSG